MLIFDTKNSYATIIVLGSLTVFIFMFWGYSQIFNSINDQVDIDVQIDKWEQTLPNSYDYTVVAGCMSLVTSKAAVRNGKHSFSLDSEKIMLSELFNIAGGRLSSFAALPYSGRIG